LLGAILGGGLGFAGRVWQSAICLMVADSSCTRSPG